MEEEAAMQEDARQHHSMNYIEFPLTEVAATTACYGQGQ
jgi:hypothetical protein